MNRILVVGAGPAGISAALYARRGGADVLVVARRKGSSALGKAELIQNYYGLEMPISGEELERRGIAGAESIGVEFAEDELLGLDYLDEATGFRAVSANHVYEAKSIIIAAGASRKAPEIPGLRELEGHGVSYCAVCDGFLYRGKVVAVLGTGEYAAHEAEALLHHAQKVFILTDGESPTEEFPAEAEVRVEKLVAVEGESKVQSAVFADGSRLSLDGLFVAIGTAGSTELARKLGVMLEGQNIRVDANMATNVPGVFAAGDCTGGLLQVAKAVYQGAMAGLSALNFLRGKY